jgi:hypothetical protein
MDTLVAQKITFPPQIDLQVSSSYETYHNKIYHVYPQQVYRGLPVANGFGAYI